MVYVSYCPVDFIRGKCWENEWGETMSKACINSVMETIIHRNPREYEFHQAVREVLESLEPALDRHPIYEKHKIL
jgi:glutamate dehydrogenase (NADP+)